MGEIYKALTDWQPWASLIITGLKSIETRGWATSFRGRIVITAARRKISEKLLSETPTLEIAIEALGLPLPMGVALGTVEVVNCQRILGVYEKRNPINGYRYQAAQLENGVEITGAELAFGNCSPGRWAWILRDPQPFAEPIPVRGMQGLWNWGGKAEQEAARK